MKQLIKSGMIVIPIVIFALGDKVYPDFYRNFSIGAFVAVVVFTLGTGWYLLRQKNIFIIEYVVAWGAIFLWMLSFINAPEINSTYSTLANVIFPTVVILMQWETYVSMYKQEPLVDNNTAIANLWTILCTCVIAGFLSTLIIYIATSISNSWGILIGMSMMVSMLITLVTGTLKQLMSQINEAIQKLKT